ncbi:putative transcription factor interactor and regulator CCHC(Zn) family [Helianthus debilis subsp. tardiflorus]
MRRVLHCWYRVCGSPPSSSSSNFCKIPTKSFNKEVRIKHSTSTDEEEKKSFWREKNSEFWKKKQAEQKKDSRTCFKCNKIGHIAKDCTQTIQSKQGVFRTISEKEFDAEKVFNPRVKHMFGKMIDRKVKGVKEFYEKKTKKEKVEPSLVCDWDGTYFEQ